MVVPVDWWSVEPATLITTGGYLWLNDWSMQPPVKAFHLWILFMTDFWRYVAFDEINFSAFGSFAFGDGPFKPLLNTTFGAGMRLFGLSPFVIVWQLLKSTQELFVPHFWNLQLLPPSFSYNANAFADGFCFYPDKAFIMPFDLRDPFGTDFWPTTILLNKTFRPRTSFAKSVSFWYGRKLLICRCNRTWLLKMVIPDPNHIWRFRVDSTRWERCAGWPPRPFWRASRCEGDVRADQADITAHSTEQSF